MRRSLLVQEKEYLCMHCRQWILEGDMTSYNCASRKGFCRKCSEKLTYEEEREIEKVGFYQGEQLSFSL